MYARVSTIQGVPERLDEAVRQFRERPAPFQQAKGFKGNYLLVDRRTGKMVAITLWDTEADLEASAGVANQSRQQGAESVGAVAPPTVEVFEVAVTPQG